MAACYTTCDYQKEAKCQQSLLKLFLELKRHHSLEKSEIEKQKIIIDQIWVLCQRYLILQRSVPDIQAYPADISQHVECEIIAELHRKIHEIHKSNKILQTSLDSVKCLYHEFEDYAESIDWSTESLLIRGSETQKPLSYYIETVYDIQMHFEKFLANLKCGIELIGIEDVQTIESYQKMLKQSEEFDEYFTTHLSFAKFVERNIK